MVFEHFIHKTTGFGFIGIHAPTSEGHFPDEALRHHITHAREGADIGGHADIDFCDAEEGIFGAVAHICRAGEIHTAAHAGTIDGNEHWHARFFQTGESFLQHEDSLHHAFAAPACFDMALIRTACKDRKIHARREMLALSGDDNHPGTGIFINVADDSWQLIPERFVHGICHFRPRQLNVGDVVFNAYVEALVRLTVLVYCCLAHVELPSFLQSDGSLSHEMLSAAVLFLLHCRLPEGGGMQ